MLLPSNALVYVITRSRMRRKSEAQYDYKRAYLVEKTYKTSCFCIVLQTR
jgi:hypothetical protein